MRPVATALLIVCALASTGCGREPSAMTAAPAAAPQEATVRAGDITVRASTIQTSLLGDAVARQYGIARADSTVLLLVAVRKGAEADETSVPATITATATDLRGRQQSVPMKELRSGDLLDYTGLVEVGAPETVRFELSVVPDGGAPIPVRFTRDFFPN